MKVKKRKQRKRKQSVRHEQRAFHARRRPSREAEKIESASSPWLRMVPANIEDDPGSDVSRRFFSNRNGRRQPRDLDLFISESISRSR